MPVMPRSAQLARREQAQQAQRDRIEDMSLQQRMMYQQQVRMQQQYRMQQQQHLQRQVPTTSSPEQRRMARRQNILTSEEVEQGVEGGTNRGRGFRIFFVALVVGILLFLMFLKVDAEINIELPPELKRLAEADNAVGEGAKSAKIVLNDKDQAKIDEFERLLNVKKTEEEQEKEKQLEEEQKTLDPETRRKLRRRESHEKKKKIEEAYKKHLEGYGQLVSCGQSCQSEHQQIQLAYEFLNQQVDHELWDVVLPADKAKEQRDNPWFVSPADVDKAFAEKKEKIEATPVATEEEKVDQQLALAELKEARDILMNEEARRYYLMTGLKPVESMRKMSARHGGWGQELLLRTHFHKLILTWMSFFGNSKVDLFVVLFVFVCLFLAPALARLPQTVAMAQRMTQEWEEMAELERRANSKQ